MFINVFLCTHVFVPQQAWTRGRSAQGVTAQVSPAAGLVFPPPGRTAWSHWLSWSCVEEHGWGKGPGQGNTGWGTDTSRGGRARALCSHFSKTQPAHHSPAFLVWAPARAPPPPLALVRLRFLLQKAIYSFQRESEGDGWGGERHGLVVPRTHTVIG